MREDMHCNGGLIRHYRKQLKLTQLQLAVKAGLSERVVRKAENNELLRADSLELLASALGTAAMPLHARDLTIDPLAIAQPYMRSYLQYGADSPPTVGGLVRARCGNGHSHRRSQPAVCRRLSRG